MKHSCFLCCAFIVLGLAALGCEQSGAIAYTNSCTVQADCPKTQTCDLNSNRCIAKGAGHCSNGELDDNESDVDCGGECSETCDDGMKCKMDSECKSQYCDDGKCRVQKCINDVTCIKGVCVDNICTSCTDGKKNGNETARDCGGPQCDKCAAGLACKKDNDCKSNQCVSSVCVAGDDSECESDNECAENLVCVDNQCKEDSSKQQTCSDEKQNGDETDIDCGGSCNPCANDAKCIKNDDCVSEYCKENKCADHDCATAAAEQIEISEVFTNPKTDNEMYHTDSKQAKFIEIYNTTSNKLRLDNLTFMVGDKQVPLSGCIEPNIYYVLSNEPIKALGNTGFAAANAQVDDAVKTNGNFTISLKHKDALIFSVIVPDMTGKDGVSAALPPADSRAKELDSYKLIPHDEIKADEEGDHPYTPGLHNIAAIPMG